MNNKLVEFAVITEVPDPETDSGNLASALVYGLPQHLRLEVLLRARVPVFTLGEILVLDTHGREISGLGRKPSKWSVTCEHFDTIEAAIDRAGKLTRDW